MLQIKTILPSLAKSATPNLQNLPSSINTFPTKQLGSSLTTSQARIPRQPLRISNQRPQRDSSDVCPKAVVPQPDKEEAKDLPALSLLGQSAQNSQNNGRDRSATNLKKTSYRIKTVPRRSHSIKESKKTVNKENLGIVKSQTVGAETLSKIDVQVQKENDQKKAAKSIVEADELVNSLIDILGEERVGLEVVLETEENQDVVTAEPNKNKKKKKKGFTALKDMVPMNLEEEKQKFFEMDCKYDPQFEYKNCEDLKQKFPEAHKKYLKVAEGILERCISEFGDDQAYTDEVGGRVCTKEEIESKYKEYVEDLRLEKRLRLEFSTKIVSSACCLYKWKGKGVIVIAMPITHQENMLDGLFHHEIGTHFVRKVNNRKQVWAKKRKEYGLSNCLVIEEGLAMLNQLYSEACNPNGKPYLFSAALHYYACCKSSTLSFQELYKDLEKYIKDPIRRWKECIRVKRGIADTSKAGGMYKDQVYLWGSIKILRKRGKIDFPLLHAGKLNLRDLDKMIKGGHIKSDKMRVPNILKDMEKYKAALDRIATFNLIDNALGI